MEPHGIRYEYLASYISPKWLQQRLPSHRSFLQCDFDIPPIKSGVCVLSLWILLGLWLWQKWYYVTCVARLQKGMQILPGSLQTLWELSHHAVRSAKVTWRGMCRCSGQQPARTTTPLSQGALRWLHPHRHLAATPWAILNRATQLSLPNQAQNQENDNEISVIWSY